MSRLAVPLVAMALLAGGCGGIQVTEDQLAESLRSAFGIAKEDERHETDVDQKAGPATCAKQTSSEFHCVLREEVPGEAPVPWRYGVKVEDDGCWTARVMRSRDQRPADHLKDPLHGCAKT